MAQKQAHTKRTTSTEAAGNLTEREKGSFSLLITDISYNARYVKYRGVKKASFLRFGFFGSLWTFRWPRFCFIGFLQFFIVWCISFAFCGCNSFFESFSITGFTGHTYIRFLRTVFFFRHASFIMVSVLEPFWSFYFSVHDHSLVLFSFVGWIPAYDSMITYKKCLWQIRVLDLS